MYEAINKKRPVKYTTTLKVMQVMHERGLLLRDESKHKHIYEPALPEEKTQGQLLANFLDKAFSGSTEKMVMQLLSGKKFTAKERATIKKMFDKNERK